METVVKLESFVPDIYKDSRDFKVFLKNGDYGLIEVDGIFHYRPQYSQESFSNYECTDV